jgi:hypothetical protein
MNHQNKYLKYKNKYQKLKQQIGGNLIETLFVPIITCFLEFNKKQTMIRELFGDDRFIHVKGGSSIKYHMMKKGLDSTGVTNDIDIFLYSARENKDDDLRELLVDLQTKIPGYTWRIEPRGELYVVFINEIQIIDITVYNELYIEPDEESSMFLYAIKNIGLETHEQYFEALKEISWENIVSKNESLETKSFTSLQFEKFSCIKGIEIYTDYVGREPVWRERLQELRTRLLTPGISEEIKVRIHNEIAKYERYVSAEYIAKLNDKLTRYQKKIQVIDWMLTH